MYSGTIVSSSSIIATISPDELRIPQLRAFDNPCLGSSTIRKSNCGCAAAKRAKSAAVESVELLFTATHSHDDGSAVCPTTDSNVCRRYGARLYVAIINESFT